MSVSDFPESSRCTAIRECLEAVCGIDSPAGFGGASLKDILQHDKCRFSKPLPALIYKHAITAYRLWNGPVFIYIALNKFDCFGLEFYHAIVSSLAFYY
ncbi:MAG: hypothetical protein SRB2_03814 [Desulfobacteraceae bacterium Eth-SRB2]|nr:MAG: hypothetical protein SRB2_03814 [Desulfobacteraceae bacterium Eth-SRB2]